MRNKEYEEFSKILLMPFIKQFNESYSACVFKDKAEILDYADDIFFRWYNSPYFRGTVLTPYKLLERKIFEITGKKPTIRITVKEMLNNKCELKLQKYDYGYEKHIIIEDLKNFVKYGELYSSGGIESLKENRKSFSIFSPKYMEYLYQLAIRLGFFDKLDSIHTEKEIYAPNNNISEIDDDLLLQDIILNAIEMSCEKLNSLLYAVDEKLKKRFASANEYMIVFDKAFDEAVLGEIVKRGAMVHDIQISILDVFDIDISKILGKRKFNFTDDEKFYLNVYNWLGERIEEYFVLPFSQYLHIFIPFYRKCFDVDFAFKQFFYNKHFKGEYSLDSSTSDRFQLTAFGEAVFDTDVEDEFDEKFEALNPDSILQFLQNEYEQSKFLTLMHNKELKLKIEKADEEDNYIVIDIVDDNVLSFLHREICLRFFEPIDLNYSFYKGDNISPFFEYPSYRKNKNVDLKKIADNCSVKNIFNRNNKKAILLIEEKEQKKTHKYYIECLSIVKPIDKKYPYLNEVGKGYTKEAGINNIYE